MWWWGTNTQLRRMGYSATRSSHSVRNKMVRLPFAVISKKIQQFLNWHYLKHHKSGHDWTWLVYDTVSAFWHICTAIVRFPVNFFVPQPKEMSGFKNETIGYFQEFLCVFTRENYWKSTRNAFVCYQPIGCLKECVIKWFGMLQEVMRKC